MSLGNAAKKSHDAACRHRMTSLLCQLNKVQEEPAERVTPVATDTRANTCEFDVGCGRHGNATDKRVVGTVDDSEMEDGHKESKRDRTIVGMEVCVLDDNCEAWLDAPGQVLEDQEDSEECQVDRRNVPEHIHRMPCKRKWPAET